MKEANGGLAEGPLEMDITDLVAGGAGLLSVGLLAAFDEASIGGEGLDGGKAGDVTDFVEEGEAKDLTHTSDGSEAAEVIRVVNAGLAEDGAFELGDEAVIVIDEGEIGLEVGLNGRIIKEFGKILAVGWTGETARGSGQVVLGECVLDVGEQLGPLACKVETAAQEVPGGAHQRGIDVGIGESTGAKEHGDLPGIDTIVLGLAAVDGFHVEGMAEDEGNTLIGAEIGQPVPAEDALGSDDQVVTVGSDSLEEEIWVAPELLVEADLALLVEDAEIEIATMEVDAAGVLVLDRIEAHGSPPGLDVVWHQHPAYRLRGRSRRGPA